MFALPIMDIGQRRQHVYVPRILLPSITANPDLPISYFSCQSSVKTHFDVIYPRNSYALEVFQHFSSAILDFHCFLIVSHSADNFNMDFYIRDVILMEIFKT